MREFRGCTVRRLYNQQKHTKYLRCGQRTIGTLTASGVADALSVATDRTKQTTLDGKVRFTQPKPRRQTHKKQSEPQTRERQQQATRVDGLDLMAGWIRLAARSYCGCGGHGVCGRRTNMYGQEFRCVACTDGDVRICVELSPSCRSGALRANAMDSVSFLALSSAAVGVGDGGGVPKLMMTMMIIMISMMGTGGGDVGVGRGVGVLLFECFFGF